MSGTSSDWWSRVLTNGDGWVGRSANASERYVVLPDVNDPRTLIDPANSAAVADALGRSRALRRVPRAAIRVGAVGAARVLQRREMWSVHTTQGSSSLRDHLRTLLGSSVDLSIAIGPARPNQKPIVRCWRRSELVAVAKLGPDPHTAEMIAHEATWLDELEKAPVEGVTVPTVLHVGEWGGGAMLLTDALTIDDPRPLRPDDMPMHLLDHFSARFHADMEPRGLLAELAERIRPESGSIECETIDALASDPRVDLVTLGFAHGDWSPWNVTASLDGTWTVWDWERATRSAPLGFDHLHLCVQYGDGDIDRALAHAGVPSELHAPTALMYLLELTARNVEAGQPAGGHQERVRSLLGQYRADPTGVAT
ncbi:MAG: hypothetical protein ACR2P0_21095 [Acidimicrobiales bacterium]